MAIMAFMFGGRFLVQVGEAGWVGQVVLEARRNLGRVGKPGRV